MPVTVVTISWNAQKLPGKINFPVLLYGAKFPEIKNLLCIISWNQEISWKLASLFWLSCNHGIQHVLCWKMHHQNNRRKKNTQRSTYLINKNHFIYHITSLVTSLDMHLAWQNVDPQIQWNKWGGGARLYAIQVDLCKITAQNIVTLSGTHQFIGLFHLKSIHPLCNIYHRPSTGGVWILNVLTQ